MYEQVYKRQVVVELMAALEATRLLAQKAQQVLTQEMLTARGLRRVEASEASFHVQLLLVQLADAETESELVRTLKECAAGLVLSTERRAVL